MSTKEQYWKYSLIAIIIGLGIILFRQIAPFMGGLLGALTIYILVRKQMMYLSDKRKMKRSIAATLITAEAILCFLVPLGLVVWLAVVNLQIINLDPQAIIAPFEEAANIIKAKTGYYILGKDTVAYVISILPRIGQAIMGGISSFAVNIFVLVFVLYFMLIGGDAGSVGRVRRQGGQTLDRRCGRQDLARARADGGEPRREDGEDVRPRPRPHGRHA